MANEAARRAAEVGITNANFYTSDLESVTGSYDTVTCVDVAIHYPTEQMAGMIGHLCSLSTDRVMFSFAPKTWYYTLLKKVGEFFPGPSKTTRAYLHEEEVVRAALKKAGFEVTREEMTATNFYFSRLLEAKRV
jgi:magnesium-protoporphyrin O-methyltransferase